MTFKTILKKAIQTKPHLVQFEKVDGTVRDLLCTLNMEYIERRWTPSGGGSPEPDNILRVWDLENDGWRSFRVDSVIERRELTDTEILAAIAP